MSAPRRAGGRADACSTVPAGITSIPDRCWPPPRRPSTNRACAASHFREPGYSGPVGQTFENAVNIDWQRSEMANYTRTINWETGTSKETFDRKPGNNPASWKYGLGWVGGTPTQASLRQTHIVNGQYAWHIDGSGAPVAVPPEMAEVYQLDLWMNPHGIPQGRAHARRQSQSRYGDGSRSKRAAMATSSLRKRCMSSGSLCSGSTASTRRSTARTSSRGSRRP